MLFSRHGSLTLGSLAVAAIAACSSPAPASKPVITMTMVTGTYAGKPLPTTESLGMYGVSTRAGTYAGAFISNLAGTCALLKTSATPTSANVDVPNTTELHVQVGQFTGTDAPIPPGTYPVIHDYMDKYQLQAGVEMTDSTCSNLPTTGDASDGSVTLDTVSPDEVTGSFDLTFSDGSHLTGQFAAPVCNFDLYDLQTNGLHGCIEADAGGD